MIKIKFLLPLVFCLALIANVASAQNQSIVNDGKVWASLYQQRAAEYKALCFQAYNAARMSLDKAIAKRGKKPLAVVTDIDETLLDNSPLDAARAINNQNFDLAAWKHWTAQGIADTVAGAPSFFKYAASKGVAVFYITNRDEDERAGTLKNLKRYNLPYADDAHVLLRGKTSSKEDRRLEVAKKYNIAILCGDNLPDFDKQYDGNFVEADRAAVTEKLRKEFGSRYIIIPNPTYGDFETALFKNQKLTLKQKDSVIKAVLKVAK